MSHRIKLIGFDLDGTVLTSEKKLTKRTEEAFRKAAEQGVIILPVTGRPLSGLPKVITELPYVKYAVTSNGARIVNVETGETLFEKPLNKGKARKILDIFGEYDTLREIYYGGIGYAEQTKLDEVDRYVAHASMAEYIRTTRRPVEDIHKKFESEDRDLDKIQGLFADLGEKQEAWKRIEELVEAEVTGALHNNIEVMEAGINKGNAIQFMAETFQLKIEETMAFGDGANDTAMIVAAGVGVGMSNGIPEVLEAADMIAESNDEDGVAKIIEKYVLE